MRQLVCILSCAILVSLTGCKNVAAENQKAKAILGPTQGNKVKGVILFTTEQHGVKIVADIEGLTPGEHGIHIHEFGDCSAPDGSSVGDHFNPKKMKHGGPEDEERHVGDLGNIVADSSGHGHYERIDYKISLDGPDSIIGRSVVVHEKKDDLKTQPSGDSGNRLACGKIVVVD